MSEPVYAGVVAANTVIMSHSLKKKKIVFVEGSHDGRLLETIFNRELHAIAARGSQGVVEAMNSIDANNSHKANDTVDAIGFIDKDYLDVFDPQNILARDNIITTTFRDIEIDLLHSDALRRLLEEKASQGKWSCEKEVVEEILENISELSMVRTYNAVAERNWDFKGIDLCKYLDTAGKLKTAKMLSVLKQKNSISELEWKNYAEWASSFEIDVRVITRGHDATNTLGQMLRSRLGNRNSKEVTFDRIEENLRLAIEKQFFETFHWFSSIREWIDQQQS